MTKTLIKILIFLIITSGCGYKVLKYSELSKFEINKIEVTGNNEINFKIKRKLNSLSKVGSDDKIVIYLHTSKSKFVKEYIDNCEELLKQNKKGQEDLRKYGSVQHAGFGMGIERVVAWICKLPHVRETIPYPRMLQRLRP